MSLQLVKVDSICFSGLLTINERAANKKLCKSLKTHTPRVMRCTKVLKRQTKKRVKRSQMESTRISPVLVLEWIVCVLVRSAANFLDGKKLNWQQRKKLRHSE